MTSDNSINDAERELLLEQYNAMRDVIRLRIQQQNRRVLSGIAGVAAVAGYSLLRESRWLFALIPFIIGVMVIQTVNSNRHVAANAQHLVHIEKELCKVTPLFCWEDRYGGMFGDEPAVLREPSRWGFSWDIFLSYGMLFIAVPIYFFTIITGYVFWPTRPEGLTFLDQYGLLFIYTLFTIYGMFLGFLSWWYKQEISKLSEKECTSAEIE